MRRLTEKNILVMQVILAVKESLTKKEQPASRLLRANHKATARAYNVPSADVVTGMLRLMAEGKGSPEKWWLPNDLTHPGDLGYAAYTQVIWESYLRAIQSRDKIRVPAQMLNASTYLSASRTRLSSLEVLPAGWRRDRPNRISAWYDALMSRWLDDEVVAENPKAAPQNPAPFQMRFRGSSVLLFGEATLASGKYRVLIDGKNALLRFSDGDQAGVLSATSGAGGNTHHVRVVAEGLDSAVEHTLEIQPLLEPGQELRLESVCVAGRGVKVFR